MVKRLAFAFAFVLRDRRELRKPKGPPVAADGIAGKSRIGLPRPYEGKDE